MVNLAVDFAIFTKSLRSPNLALQSLLLCGQQYRLAKFEIMLLCNHDVAGREWVQDIWKHNRDDKTINEVNE